MAEQFMVELSEATAATCFQCIGENETVEGQDGLSVNDLYDRMCRTMTDAFASTSRAGCKDNHRKIFDGQDRQESH